MHEPESEYWGDEFSDDELNQIADQAAPLDLAPKAKKKSAASQRRQKMAEAVERGDREEFNQLLADLRRTQDELADPGDSLLQLCDEMLEDALDAGKRGLARKIEVAISTTHDVLDRLEALRAELEGE